MCKAINLKEEALNTNLMKASRRDAVIDDLLKRRPDGDTGENPQYEEESYYCYDAHKNKKNITCNHRGWGYSDETIWDMGFRCEGDVSEYIFNRFYKDDATLTKWYLTQGKRAGVTRKTNRVWSRITSSLSRTRSRGSIPGLYSVNIGWENTFYFYGESVLEIEGLAETMLRPVYPGESFTIQFIDRSLPGDILDRNVKSFEKLERKVAALKERAVEALKTAEGLENQSEYVKTLITQNLEVAMRAT